MVLPRDVRQPSILPEPGFAGGPAFHGSFVGGNEALTSANQADSAHNSRSWSFVFQAIAGQRRDLQKKRSLIQQQFYAVARQEFAALKMPLHILLAAAFGGALQFGPQSLHRRLHGGVIADR